MKNSRRSSIHSPHLTLVAALIVSPGYGLAKPAWAQIAPANSTESSLRTEQAQSGYGLTNTSQDLQNHGEPEEGPKAAAPSSSEAEFLLGYQFELGQGVPKDYVHAAAHYTVAAKQGHPTAQNNLASMYERGQGMARDWAEAAHWYRAAAEQGNPVAQCNLASLYFLGHGVHQDYEQAARWFGAAAEQGYAPAQDNLSSLYYRGKGVPRNLSRAANWARKAAEQGYARAQTDLGYLYEQGNGVPLDYVTAFRLYSLAFAGGDERSQSRISSLARVMTERQIRDAQVGVQSATMPRNSIAKGFQDSTTRDPLP